ncbi:GntR family transcriptional regulator [Orenia metallireducens]|uniref:Transcriptional regulator, GntR family n=1 Tax=Orenia metallireducens TaxID=1413210 RepID=A0A285IJK8_9FIRM|nr:GntR family transcriptional regulator [Orenia metallireducens]PRX16185.1 GntR family transcriptional regulator [Orenia metallireducens]SNY48169.1 transcriptional regulator, GntR family [Orenia metallireducens]
MHTNRLPKYIQVKNNIEKIINSGQLKPRDKLPTESELCEIYGVSRHTIRKALNILEQDGLVYKKQGLGTFCSDNQKKKTYNIGFISISLHDYIFSDILAGIDSVLHKNGYQIILGNSKDDHYREKEILNEFLKKDVDGLIIEPAKSGYAYPNINLLERFVDNNIPVVILDSDFDNNKFNYVTVNDQQGGYLATNHFIEEGHENIAVIYKGLHKPSINRFKGYEQALKENNIPVYNDYIKKYYISEFENLQNFEQEIKSLVIELLEVDKSPTAIFCFNDQVAILVKEILDDLNYQIPEDISIIGFDDSKLVRLRHISITSVTHPKMIAGERAANIILENIDSGVIDSNKKITFAPKLIERDSVNEINKNYYLDNLA